MMLIIEEAKETYLDSSQETKGVFWIYSTNLFWFNIISIYKWLSIKL